MRKYQPGFCGGGSIFYAGVKVPITINEKIVL